MLITALVLLSFTSASQMDNLTCTPETLGLPSSCNPIPFLQPNVLIYFTLTQPIAIQSTGIHSLFLSSLSWMLCLFTVVKPFIHSRFPSKEDVLEFVVGVTRRYLNNHPKTIVVVGAYTIGKEQVYLAISQALGVS